MTTGYDVSGIVPPVKPPSLDDQAKTTLPALVPCGACGQALPNHLSVCPLLPSSAIPVETIEAVNAAEKKLGMAT